MIADRKQESRKGALCLVLAVLWMILFVAVPAKAADDDAVWGEDVLGASLLGNERSDSAQETGYLETNSDAMAERTEDTENTDASGDAENTSDLQTEDLIEEGLLSQDEYEALDWTDLATTDVDDYLNVRAAADSDGTVIGRIYAGSLVVVEDAGDEWTRISSGNVEGYAATEYLLFDTDAQAYADENISYAAVVSADSVRIRAEESTESTVVAHADEGDELEWDIETQTGDEWVAVIYNDTTRYVSADYVETGIRLSTALTNEEAKEYEASVAGYSSSDLALLAALIYCEAGGESYAGKLAVGAVVVNRVKSSKYPNTVSGVIYQSGQFSPASSGWLKKVLSSGSATSSCYEAAKEALSGVSNIGSCLHFHAGSGSGTKIGNQTFY